MWLSSLLLIIAFTSVIGEEEEPLGYEYWIGFSFIRRSCFRDFEKSDVKTFKAASKEGQMETLCSLTLNFFNCLDGEMVNEFGNSIEEIAQFLVDRGDAEGSLFKIVVNVKNVVKDVCTNGTQLNRDLKADLDCFNSIDEEELIAECKNEMELYEFAMYNEVATVEVAEEEEDYYDYRGESERDCITDLFLAGCASSKILEKCGHRAFTTFNTILKRTTIFPNMICPTEKFEEIKTTLIALLDMTGKEDYKLGLDLKRRR